MGNAYSALSAKAIFKIYLLSKELLCKEKIAREVSHSVVAY
jgi:hypothetical protein